MTIDTPCVTAISEHEVDRVFREDGLYQLLFTGLPEEKEPELQDLARLWILTRQRKPFCLLEFGSGHSILILASALKKNWDEYRDTCGGTGRFEQPRLLALETHEKWRENTESKVQTADLADFVTILPASVHVAEYNGQLCHFYDELPDVVPDFVYLDGPASSSIQGEVNGLSFRNPSRTVMSADILKYESTLLPGFFMIVDGRTNNARFLRRMLTRAYIVRHDPIGDVTTFELDETPLGRKNIMGWQAYSGGLG